MLRLGISLIAILSFVPGLLSGQQAPKPAGEQTFQVPRQAPEFVIQAPNGPRRLLSEFKGKVVVLEFLYTTCPHCQTCSTIMNKLYQELGPRGFQPLGVAFNPMAGMLVPDYVRQLQLGFPVGASEREPVLAFLQLSPDLRFVVPQLVILDRQGVIRLQSTGNDEFFREEEKNMRAEILKLLAEPHAGKTPAAAPKNKKKIARGNG